MEAASDGFAFHHDDHPNADFGVGAQQRRAVDPSLLYGWWSVGASA